MPLDHRTKSWLSSREPLWLDRCQLSLKSWSRGVEIPLVHPHAQSASGWWRQHLKWKVSKFFLLVFAPKAKKNFANRHRNSFWNQISGENFQVVNRRLSESIFVLCNSIRNRTRAPKIAASHVDIKRLVAGSVWRFDKNKEILRSCPDRSLGLSLSTCYSRATSPIEQKIRQTSYVEALFGNAKSGFKVQNESLA